MCGVSMTLSSTLNASVCLKAKSENDAGSNEKNFKKHAAYGPSNRFFT
jgi:hypothetical protein